MKSSESGQGAPSLKLLNVKKHFFHKTASKNITQLNSVCIRSCRVTTLCLFIYMAHLALTSIA